MKSWLGLRVKWPNPQMTDRNLWFFNQNFIFLYYLILMCYYNDFALLQVYVNQGSCSKVTKLYILYIYLSQARIKHPQREMREKVRRITSFPDKAKKIYFSQVAFCEEILCSLKMACSKSFARATRRFQHLRKSTLYLWCENVTISILTN